MTNTLPIPKNNSGEGSSCCFFSCETLALLFAFFHLKVLEKKIEIKDSFSEVKWI